MKTRQNKRLFHPMWYLLFLAIFLTAGCASDKMAQKDPFFEKWSVMAETAKGSSPAAKEKVIELPSKTEVESFLRGDAIEEKPLPVMRVTMKLRQADVKSVLRSLARIAGKNLLIKDAVKGDISVDFKNVPWNEAFISILRDQALTYAWEGEILRVMTPEDLEQDHKRKMQQLATRQVEPLLTVMIGIDYADASKMKDNLQAMLTPDKDGKPRGSVRVDEHTNSLIVQAIRDDLKRMVPIIQKIDKPTPQIHIKAHIVETSKELARDLGIQWGGLWNSGDLYMTPGGSGTPPTTPPSYVYNPVYGSTGIAKQGFGVNFPVDPAKMAAAGGAGSLGLIFGTLGGNLLEVQLTALQKDGKLNILSSPSITTLDNQLAFTENGEKVPYVSTDSDGDREVKFEDAVLRLEITPHVIDDENLKLKILVKKDEVDMSRRVEGNPFIIKKQTETTLIVRNGETIVISGLTKQRVSSGQSGVPWLEDIPGLGHLFKSTSKADAKEEVLIFITPQILKVALSKADVPLRIGAP